MTLIARPIHSTFDGGRTRSDFELLHNGVAIGQICQTPDLENPIWFWSLYGHARDGYPPSGLANSLVEAQSQFRAAARIDQ